MPLGDQTLDTISYLATVSGEKSCPVCYHIYLKKYLSKTDRHALLQTAWDCSCDGNDTSKSYKGRFHIDDLKYVR